MPDCCLLTDCTVVTIPPALTSSAGLLVPTSDLEEEWRSESEEDDPADQILSIRLEVEEEVRLVHLQVNKKGVRLVSCLKCV